jgi:isocitrate/isopropylmalate dehydrogenase
MLLDYLAKDEAARSLRQAIAAVYAEQGNLTADQGGSASTTDFFNALRANLPGT